MEDNKDRQKQQVQRQKEMKVLLKEHQQQQVLPRDSSFSSPSPSPSPIQRRERRVREERERRINSNVEEEEEEDDYVAPKRLAGSHIDTPGSCDSKKFKNPPNSGRKKQRTLRDLSLARLGANGTLLTPSPAMDDDHTHSHFPALFGSHEEKDKQNQSVDVTRSNPGTPSELQLATPMPDKKMLFAALDKFQKKDAYGVFSEPVDPEELPDYFDIIKNPMDFGTIRKNLESGIYRSLEQFEKDVLLVCSNAMSYNASGTIYYRQARSIQELANKTFQSLRCDSEGRELECERKPALKTKPSPYNKLSRRGVLGRPRLDSARSDLASGSSFASNGEHVDRSNDAAKLRRGAVLDRSCTFLDGTGRILQVHNSSDVNSPAELSEDFSGSMVKGTSVRDGRRDLLLEENRRATYKPWNSSMAGNESIFMALAGNSKQLVNYLQTGIPSEYAYARSLACFSAELGPKTWKIAAKKIEKSLPANMPFGPGWVGEYEAPRSALLLREESNDQQTSTPSNAMPTDHGVNKVTQLGDDQASAKKHGFEGNSYLCSSISSMAAHTDVLPAIQSAGLPVTQSMGSHLSTEKNIHSQAQVVKTIELKSPSPVLESREVNLAGTNFASDVSQSRLLEIVSRNRLMQWTSTKQVDHKQPVSSLQASAAGSICVERRDNGTSTCTARESRDDSQPLSNSGNINAGLNAVRPSVTNYEGICRDASVPQSTCSQEHGMQDLNRLVNSSQNKIQVLQQRASNMSVNNPIFGFSSAPLRHTTVRRGDAVAEAWARSQPAEHIHGEATPGIKMQITSDAYYKAQQSQTRPPSSVPQFMQQAPLDMSFYMRSPLGRMHPQSLSKFSHTSSQGNVGQITDASNSTMLRQFNMQTPGVAESSQSDFSHSIPPDLNVRFQSPKSPVMQSSGVLADSQPDLALQL